MLTKRDVFEDGSSTVSVVGDDGETVEVSFPPGFDPMDAHAIASGRFALLHDLKDFSPRSLICARLYIPAAARIYPRARDAIFDLLNDEQAKLWAFCERNCDQSVAFAIQGLVRDAIAGVPSVDDLVSADDHVAVFQWYEELIDPEMASFIAQNLTRIFREK